MYGSVRGGWLMVGDGLCVMLLCYPYRAYELTTFLVNYSVKTLM